MPNINNFETDITQLAELYSKFTVSRVIANKKDDLLDLEVPAEFDQKFLDNNIEINLYSLADNSLIYSDFIKNSQAITIQNVQYSDNTSRTLLFIDFKKLDVSTTIPSGQYSVTLNFFTDEIGSYDNRILKISKISTARTEVELKLMDTNRQKELETFAVPRIPVQYIKDVLKQIFNQEGADEISLPTSPIKIDQDVVYENFNNNYGQQLITYGFDQDAGGGARPGINTIIQSVLNTAYLTAVETIDEEITKSATQYLTQTELSNYVVTAIDSAYNSYINMEVAKNPSKYRFDLV